MISHSVSFDVLMPLFLSEPVSFEQPHLPFKFTGGFALSTKTIGFMMAVQGVYSMVAQLLLFPFLVRRFGTLQTFRLAMVVWPLLYAVVPYLVLLPVNFQRLGIYASLIIKITFHVIAFPSTAILIANAAPSKSVLGSINGVAASCACLARALGPTITGFFHTAGLQMGYNGTAWWIAGLICAVGAIESFWMEEAEADPDQPCEEERQQHVCDPLLQSLSVDSPNDDLQRRASFDSLEGFDISQAGKA
jgi:Na+/melibiose symporter-like transporter